MALDLLKGADYFLHAHALLASVALSRLRQGCREDSGADVVAVTTLPLVSVSSAPCEGGQWHATGDRPEAALPSFYPVEVFVPSLSQPGTPKIGVVTSVPGYEMLAGTGAMIPSL